MLEVVAGVGVRHQDVAAARSFNSCDQRRAVAARRDVHDACTFGDCDRLGAVGRAVVRDDDFARDVAVADGVDRLPDAVCEGLGLIQAWHEDREVEIGYWFGHCSMLAKAAATTVGKSAVTVAPAGSGLRRHLAEPRDGPSGHPAA